MGFLQKLGVYRRIMTRRTITMSGLPELLRRRPFILAGVSAYEAGLMASSRVDTRLKMLAQVKASALVGCAL